ncbi:hypothetical protein DTO96_101851 [Ephemeroptericola cinctiostellae]|uniref:Uncharacterized protein n=1 Tax=Ephemeroptericola cinctiostellae TaxID=2268024 RepID=A0A345DCM2_9BURK|nr:hypothetical protein [Ephemeroptericola cinctiostellae]AXF86110.1 hypothetical protein DTO96_101851 [Ephemeroptericola cinctiostellae]
MDQVSDDVSAVLTYPEHHAVWLDVMGISRWASTASLGGAVSVANAPVLEGLPEPVLVVAAKAVVADLPVLPKIIQAARYWVIGVAPLDDDACRLLAGMMAAIQATEGEVVYSSVQDGVEHVQTTGMATWPRLNVCHVSELNVSLPETLSVLLLGDVDFPEGHHRVWRIPALADMLSEPLLKREAWVGLKAMWAQP